MIARRSVPRLLLSAMVLGGVPALSLARQGASHDTVKLALPAIVSFKGKRVHVETALHQVNLNNLAGDKKMSVGDIVYLHLNLSSSGEDKKVQRLNYPYAISQNRPTLTDRQTLSLRGIVTEKDGVRLTLQYLFEDLPHRSPLASYVSNAKQQQAMIILSVNHRAVGHVESLEVNGETFALR